MITQINFKLKIRLGGIDINKIKPFPGNGAKNLMWKFASVRIVQVIKCILNTDVEPTRNVLLLSTEITNPNFIWMTKFESCLKEKLN